MLFIFKNEELHQCNMLWQHKELQIEKLIVSTASPETPILSEEIFGEDLFYVDRQIINSDKKRSDIVALDKNGNVVIVELKKDEGKLGVEMQALQYLSNLSQYRGKDFIKEFCSRHNENEIDQFLNEGISIDNINEHSRIILVARYFDKALFSMGKWLCEQGISFKCIAYEPLQFGSEKLLNFSIVFDQVSFGSQFKLEFSSRKREAATYWHNIGFNDQESWKHLINNSIITTSFDCQPGDRGEEILKNYQKGDIVLAYVSKKGCVGYGEITDLSYELIDKGCEDDVFDGFHLHRKTIKWRYVIDISNAIAANEFEKDFGVPHPIQTSSKIKRGNINGLLDKIKLLGKEIQ